MALLARGGDPLELSREADRRPKAVFIHRQGPLRGPIPTLRLEASG